MEREKRNRADADKSKRKLDGELRISNENLEELNKQRQDAEASLKRKEADVFAVSVRNEEAQSLTAKLQRQIRDNNERLKELEADLESERQARARSERSKNELQYEVDELQEQIEQHNFGTTTQVIFNNFF